MKKKAFTKKTLIKNLTLPSKIIGLILLAVIPALLVFTYLDIQKGKEKAFLLGEIENLKEKVLKFESKTLTSTQSSNLEESTKNSVYNPFSSLIDKLLEEKACYQTAIANIKMEDIDRLNQLTKEKCEPKDHSEDYYACLLKMLKENAQEQLLLSQKTDRKGFEDKIELINEMLNSLYKGQYPSEGDPNSINFCDSSIYKSIMGQ